MTKQYRKLVRDRIPQIIEESGNSCTTEILTQEAYLNYLDAKLTEELEEYQQSKSLEELADLLEVIRAVTAARDYTWEELEALRLEKKNSRGGFDDRILLLEVTNSEG